jgi:hypothetical protein
MATRKPSPEQRGPGAVRLSLGTAGEALMFDAQARYSEALNVAPSRSVILRRALQLMIAHLSTIDEMDEASKQMEELTLMRLEKAK